MQTAPFSRRQRGFQVESLPERWGYAFNFEEPAGVKLVRPALHSQLKESGELTQLASANPAMASAVSELFRNPRAGHHVTRLTVWLHVINGCNFACHYCYIPHLNRLVEKHEIAKHSVAEKT